MKTTHLYNTAHPLAESGKPIFIPFGEWAYDGTTRQRLDRAHGERIANELNARVARGEPGIPVYAGHPDVPQLAAKYPDKGALGWVERIELANEGGRDGLALTVAWDRDPGRGFRWFSPYWLANGREGSTYVVDSIASIGLVNNPNIPEFRLANEAEACLVATVAAGAFAAGATFAANAADASGVKLKVTGVAVLDEAQGDRAVVKYLPPDTRVVVPSARHFVLFRVEYDVPTNMNVRIFLEQNGDMSELGCAFGTGASGLCRGTGTVIRLLDLDGDVYDRGVLLKSVRLFYKIDSGDKLGTHYVCDAPVKDIWGRSPHTPPVR